ncbi:riboflavin biosynthesis protein ribd, partial [mine drainage metagenome]
MEIAEDQQFMEMALALALEPAGRTSPNPRVGAVLVKDGQVIGQGYHRGPGHPHAETEALREAGEKAQGATLYVTLEPCCHHGHTPPCTAALIAAKLARVVSPIEDPNPVVAGRGIRELRHAGISVDVGVLEDAAESL